MSNFEDLQSRPPLSGTRVNCPACSMTSLMDVRDLLVVLGLQPELRYQCPACDRQIRQVVLDYDARCFEVRGIAIVAAPSLSSRPGAPDADWIGRFLTDLDDAPVTA